jgi:large subunit ribosomal protein L3
MFLVKFPGLVGKKRGMTQIFTNDGSAVPVTVIELCPMTVTQLKSNAKEGYTAVQVGFGDAKEKHLTKAQMQHLKKNSIALKRHLKEFRVSEADLQGLSVGDAISESFLEEGVEVNAQSKSIGKGFQGNIKRWNQHRGPMSHGSKNHRLPGSIGAGTTPGRVYKGKKMAGNMGNEIVTVKGLVVVKVIADKNLVLVKGAVPGVEGGLVTLTPSSLKRVGG